MTKFCCTAFAGFYSRPSSRFMLTALLIAVAVLALPRSAVSQSPKVELETAWTDLWQNDFRAAEKSFYKITEKDKSNASAKRGLILAQLAQGREAFALETFALYTKDVPLSPYDIYLMEWLDANTSLTSKKHYETLFKFAHNLATEKNSDLYDRRLAWSYAIEYAEYLGDTKTLIKAAEDLNRIRDYALLGPFDNTSGSGHRKDHISDYGFIPQRQYTGKFGQPINWFQPEKVSLAGKFVPSDYFYRKVNTTAYLKTQLQVPAAGTYLLSFGCAGDVDLAINGKPFFSCPQETAGQEKFHWLIDLPAGWVQLGLKVSAEEHRAGVTCSLSHPDGSTIKGLVVDPKHNTFDAVGDLNPRPVEGQMGAAIEVRAKDPAENMEARFWNILRSQGQDSPDDYRELQQEIIAAYPKCGLMRLATLNGTQEGDPSLASMLAEILAEAPKLSAAVVMQAKLNLGKKRYNLALEALDEVLKEAQDCYTALLAKMEVLEKSGMWEDMQGAAVKAQFRFPDEAEPYYALGRFHLHQGSLREDVRYRKEGDKRQLPGLRLYAAFVKNWQQEDFGAARRDIEELTRLQPQVDVWWYAYLRAMVTDGEKEDALVELLSYIKSFPQNQWFQGYLASFIEAGVVQKDGIYRQLFTPAGSAAMQAMLGGSSSYVRQDYDQLLNREAAFVLVKSLEVNPANFATRDRINGLLGRPSFRVAMPDPKIADIEKLRVDPAAYSGEDAVVLLSQKRCLVFDNRASLVDYAYAVQILTEEGMEQWEDFSFRSSRGSDPVVVSKTVIKEDGVETEGEQYSTVITFPGLSIGDIVFIHYQTNEFVTGNLSGYLWDQHLFSFARNRCLKSRYEIIYPDGVEVEAREWNGAAFAAEGYPRKEGVSGKMTRRVWEYANIPAGESEPYSPSALSYLPWVDVSNVGGWGDIAGWYADIAEGQIQIDRHIKKKAAELAAECTTDDELVAKVFHFVANEIRYESIPFFQSAYIPRRASAVLLDGYGDCKDKACLMMALLKAEGHTGYKFALVTPYAPSNRPFLPSPRFNHAIVCRAQDGGGYQWYDPTFTKGDMGQVPRYLAGTVALVVDEQTEDLVIIEGQPASDYPYVVASEVEVLDNGDGLVNRRETIKQVDHVAWIRRDMGDDIDSELQSKQSKNLAVQFPGVMVEEVDLQGTEPGSDGVQRETRFRVPQFGVNDDGIMSVDLPWSSQLADRFATITADPKREVPVDLWRLNICEEDRIDLKLPAGLVLSRTPKDVEYIWQGCRYATQYSQVEGGLLAQRTLVIAGDVVNRQAYEGFKTWLDQVLRDLGKSHHLRLD